jgi:hypothetical protein
VAERRAGARRRRKNLVDRGNFLFPVQASDFTQNSQRNRWKRLANSAANFEMFGAGLQMPHPKANA